MAILPSLPEINISVLVGGVTAQPPEEYDDPDPPKAPDNPAERPIYGICSKYIESQDGADMAFLYQIGNLAKAKYLPPKKTLCLRTTVDGEYAEGRLFDKQSTPRSARCEGSEYIDAATGECRKRGYRFASISTVEDASTERAKQDAKLVASMGIIKITVDCVTRIGMETGPRTQFTPDVHGQQLSEKALKGKSLDQHAVISYKVVPKTGRMQPVKYHQPPLAIFFFKYRSLGLYNEGIIPRPRMPTPEDGINGLTLDELRRLAAERLAQINPKQDGGEDSKRGIKRERGGDDARRVIKREHDEEDGIIDVDVLDKRASKKRRVTIDLTDD